MLKQLFIIGILFINISTFGQINDDFSNSKLNNTWFGDTNNFIINKNNQLQLNNTVSGLSYLSSQLFLKKEMEWHLWIKLSFATSANNYGCFYLISENPDLSANPDGYFLQIGGQYDSIQLFKKKGSDLTCLITAKNIHSNNTTNSFDFKITLDSTGKWTLGHKNDNNNFVSDGFANNQPDISECHTGILCKYTSSNASKFYFDNIYAGPKIIDSIPAVLNTSSVIDENHLIITWNESIKTATALNPQNYFIIPDIGSPNKIIPHQTLANTFILELNNPLLPDTNYQLMIRNIEDLEGNKTEVIHPFVWHCVQWQDIVINEIMFDPTPNVELPECEYLELYNNTSSPIPLNHWKLLIGENTFELENAIIPPKSYLICCSNESLPQMSSFGSCYGFNSFYLNNSGTQIILLSDKNEIISEVNYTENYYQDHLKKEGGWSVEQIDANYACIGELNWRASISASGGTPGGTNSVSASTTPETLPQLYARAFLTTDTTIELTFPSSINPILLKNKNHYQIENNNITNLIYQESNPHNIILTISNPINDFQIRHILLSDQFIDCLNRKPAPNEGILFGKTQRCDSSNIIINEILANAKYSGTDYVEIVNNSNKAVDLKDISLTKINKENLIESIYALSKTSFAIYPQEYIVLSKNAQQVYPLYNNPQPNQYLNINNFPDLNASEEHIALISKENIIIDQFKYNESMHFPLLNSTDGVALERINFFGKTNDFSNWHSASETSLFGTPGNVNSQYASISKNADWMWLQNEIFSPDNDGKEDILNIHYQLDNPGYLLTLTLFDPNGRLVRTLCNNTLISTHGFISWDGINNQNQICPIGIYIVVGKAFHPNGNTLHFKKTAVLGCK